MITNPTQAQIDNAIKRNDMIKVEKRTFIEKLFNKWVKFITGTKPDYVLYNGELYDNIDIFIVSKEEAASIVLNDIPGVIFKKGKSLLPVRKMIKVNAGINKVSFSYDNIILSLDYNELSNIFLTVKNRYNSALEHPKAGEYVEVKKIRDTYYTHNGYTYEFINGFYIDIMVTKNLKTNKYRLVELSFGIETEDFDTFSAALNNLYDIIEARVNILLENKFTKADTLIKRERITGGSEIEF